MFVLGKISTGDTLYASGYCPRSNPKETTLRQWCVDEGLAADADDVYVYYVLDESSETAERIYRKDEFLLEWTNDEITGFDFSPEDSKCWLEIITDKDTIDADDIDEATITVNMLNPDKSLKTDCNIDLDLECCEKDNQDTEPLDFTNGAATFKYKTGTPTVFLMYYGVNYNPYRLLSGITINAV